MRDKYAIVKSDDPIFPYIVKKLAVDTWVDIGAFATYAFAKEYIVLNKGVAIKVRCVTKYGDCRWFNLNGILVKNPTIEELSKYDKTQITEYFCCDMEDVVIETWYVGDGEDDRYIKFAYSLKELNEYSNLNLTKREILEIMRNNHFRNNNLNPDHICFMRSVYMPKSIFIGNNMYFNWYTKRSNI